MLCVFSGILYKTQDVWPKEEYDVQYGKKGTR